MYNDEDIKIEWPEVDVEYTLSEKDQNHPVLREANIKFKGEN